MNYTNIFKKAIEITRKNKFLWLFGILIAFGSGIESIDYDRDYLKNHLAIAITAIIIIILVLVILATVSRAGLIRSLGRITEKKTASFKGQWSDGRRFFWKIIGLEAILTLSFIAAIAILFMPVFFLFANKNHTGGAIVGVLAFLIFLILMAILTSIRVFGRLYMILGEIGIFPSMEKAYALFKNNLKESIAMLLLFIPLGILAYLATVILWSSVSSLFSFIDWLATNMTGKSLGAAGDIAKMVIFMPIMIFIRAVYEVFSQSAWVIFFYQIASPKEEEALKEKEEEEDKASAPDAAISGNCS